MKFLQSDDLGGPTLSPGVGGGWSTVIHQVQSQCSIHQEISEHVTLPPSCKLYG